MRELDPCVMTRRLNGQTRSQGPRRFTIAREVSDYALAQ